MDFWSRIIIIIRKIRGGFAPLAAATRLRQRKPTPSFPILVNFYVNQKTMAISHILC